MRGIIREVIKWGEQFVVIFYDLGFLNLDFFGSYDREGICGFDVRDVYFDVRNYFFNRFLLLVFVGDYVVRNERIFCYFVFLMGDVFGEDCLDGFYSIFMKWCGFCYENFE